MADRAEFSRFIPDFEVIDRNGGTVVTTAERSNEIAWQALTSIGVVEFLLVKEGFWIRSLEAGINLIYDENGVISEIAVDPLIYLSALLDKKKDAMEIDDGDFEDLERVLDESEVRYELYLDFKNFRYYVLERNKHNMLAEVTTEEKISKEKSYVLVEFNEEEMEFGIMVQVFDDGVIGVEIGMYEEGECDESVGDVPGYSDVKGEPKVQLLGRFISSDCNFMTFLDSKAPDRFEKLVKRIFPY